MRSFAYAYGNESAASQRRAGRYNYATAIRWQHRNKIYRAVIPCGIGDEWEVFRDGAELFVVSRNIGLGYCGLSRFDYNPGGDPDIAIGSKRITVTEKAGQDVFLDNASEAFGDDKREDWMLLTLAKRLLDWIE